MHLDDAALFVRIAELGTLSAAARERGIAVSQVTRALARLEAGCGMRLMHRGTHGLSLTDEGDTFLAYARRLLDTAAELQGELSGRLDGPSGWVRVSVSTIMAQAIIVPGLPDLYERHPGLQLDIAAEDRIVDMAREGIDIAIRTGTPASEVVVARPLGTLHRRLYAAPAYAARHGLPARVEDLRRHRLIGNSGNAVLNQWRLGRGPGAEEILVRGHTRTDNTAVVLSLVCAGVGIGRVIDLVAEPLVARGELLPVLPELGPSEPLPVYAVMLKERHRLPKLRACIEHWAGWLQASGRA